MNKNLIRVCAVLVLLSPWIYIDNSYKEAALVIISIIILIATVSSRKKVMQLKDQPSDSMSK